MTDNNTAIAVIGAGTMGNGIAQVCAQHGHPVTLVDLKQELLDQALQTVRKNLGRQVAKGTFSQAEADSALASIKPTTQLEDAAGAKFVLEAASENSDWNVKLLASHARHCVPKNLLASHPSPISITLLTSRTRRPAPVQSADPFSRLRGRIPQIQTA